ncbi:MAG TPA: alpha/beta hydrolase [Candidatus Limnocylindrales bacterium]|nr:alpha/beta hydrolase [Candidatus Limnocylindrales bacterium]
MIATADDGTRLHYVVEGSGPPVVLVGGKSSTIAGAWWRFLPALTDQFRVIAFDNRGAGDSDKPDRAYTTRLLAEDAWTVLHAAGETSAHWFGLSLGGMVLQELALAHPEAVRSLILGATHCGGREALTPLSERDRAALAHSPYRRLATLYTPAFLLEHPDWVAQDAAHFGKMPLHAIIRQDQAAAAHNACDRLQGISCPVLILHGADDRMIPASRAQDLHRRIPHSELRILPGGHQFYSERFEDVLQLVHDFIVRAERARVRP